MILYFIKIDKIVSFTEFNVFFLTFNDLGNKLVFTRINGL